MNSVFSSVISTGVICFVALILEMLATERQRTQPPKVSWWDCTRVRWVEPERYIARLAFLRSQVPARASLHFCPKQGVYLFSVYVLCVLGLESAKVHICELGVV